MKRKPFSVVIFNGCFLVFHREEESAGFRKEFHIFFVPRKSLLCEKKLKVRNTGGTCARLFLVKIFM